MYINDWEYFAEEFICTEVICYYNKFENKTQVKQPIRNNLIQIDEKK